MASLQSSTAFDFTVRQVNVRLAINDMGRPKADVTELGNRALSDKRSAYAWPTPLRCYREGGRRSMLGQRRPDVRVLSGQSSTACAFTVRQVMSQVNVHQPLLEWILFSLPGLDKLQQGHFSQISTPTEFKAGPSGAVDADLLEPFFTFPEPGPAEMEEL
ncbi:unnamed protein product [Leuciscus chuanchicus]